MTVFRSCKSYTPLVSKAPFCSMDGDVTCVPQRQGEGVLGHEIQGWWRRFTPQLCLPRCLGISPCVELGTIITAQLLSIRQTKQVKMREGGYKTQDGQEPFLPLFTAIFLQIFYCEKALLHWAAFFPDLRLEDRLQSALLVQNAYGISP